MENIDQEIGKLATYFALKYGYPDEVARKFALGLLWLPIPALTGGLIEKGKSARRSFEEEFIVALTHANKRTEYSVEVRYL
jgi:hypothetical protein